MCTYIDIKYVTWINALHDNNEGTKNVAGLNPIPR